MFSYSSQQVNFSSSSIGHILIIKWISPHHQLDISSSSLVFHHHYWIFLPHEVDLSSSSIGFSSWSSAFLLIKKRIPPPQSSSIGYLLLIKWISPPCQLYFSPSSIGFILLIKWISPNHQFDFSSS